MKIILLRHGQTDANLESILDGQKLNQHLNQTGVKQALAVKEGLKNHKIDLIITSPLNRAKETATYINENHNVPVIEDVRLIEKHFGIYDGKKMSPEELHTFRLYYLNRPTPQGETMPELVSRAYSFLDDIKGKYKNKTILIVTHGFPFRAIMWYFDGLPVDDSSIENIPNCVPAEYEI